MVVLIPQYPVKYPTMYNDCTMSTINIHEKQKPSDIKKQKFSWKKGYGNWT